jgi:AraC-like DNA-binding protein
MKNPLTRTGRQTNEFVASFYYTLSETVRRLFYAVVRAGHVRAAYNYRVEREHLPGHDLLLCLDGGGYVLAQNRRFRVRAGELAWISGYQPHAHWSDAERPWELYWVRLDGRHVQETVNVLSVQRLPVFTRVDFPRLRTEFERILTTLQNRPGGLEAIINAAVAEILAVLFENRQVEVASSLSNGRSLSPTLQNSLTKMTLYPDRTWRVEELAKLCGLSEPQFYRRFRQVTGSSPIDWLRRERISHARRRLVESDDPIKQIAEQVGYNDPFYFSRDFKRYTGMSPSEYRRTQPGERA